MERPYAGPCGTGVAAAMAARSSCGAGAGLAETTAASAAQAIAARCILSTTVDEVLGKIAIGTSSEGRSRPMSECDSCSGSVSQ